MFRAPERLIFNYVDYRRWKDVISCGGFCVARRRPPPRSTLILKILIPELAINNRGKFRTRGRGARAETSSVSLLKPRENCTCCLFYLRSQIAWFNKLFFYGFQQFGASLAHRWPISLAQYGRWAAGVVGFQCAGCSAHSGGTKPATICLHSGNQRENQMCLHKHTIPGG